MIDLLNKVEKYINSEENLKFAARIEVLRIDHGQDKFAKRKYDEDKFTRFDKRPKSDI